MALPRTLLLFLLNVLIWTGLIVSMLEFAISLAYNTECSNDRVMTPATWLLVDGIIGMIVGSCAFANHSFDSLILSTWSIFIVFYGIWGIVGSIVIFRDSWDCDQNAVRIIMAITVLFHFVFVALSCFFYQDKGRGLSSLNDAAVIRQAIVDFRHRRLQQEQQLVAIDDGGDVESQQEQEQEQCDATVEMHQTQSPEELQVDVMPQKTPETDLSSSPHSNYPESQVTVSVQVL